MIHLLSFADHNMSIALNKCLESGLKHGVDNEIQAYPSMIDRTFRFMNDEILSSERGCGFWLWKPYFIYRSLLELPEGDILIYSDAGIEFVNDVSHIISAMGDENIFLFTNTFRQVEWTKMDVTYTINKQQLTIFPTHDGDIISMNGFEEQKQVQASNIFFRVNKWTRRFVKEWLLYCQMPGLIDDSPSIQPNVPTFADHRHDQSILTALAIKYGIQLHWFPSSTALHMERTDSYPVMWVHHRKRNNEW